MNVEVYYFSGTGNSLVIARDLAKRLGGKALSIAAFNDRESLTPAADTVGIVFPIYYNESLNVPLIVRRFIGKLDGIESKYVFAVCNFGGSMSNSMEQTDAMLRERGGSLASGFGVHMPQNSFVKPYENLKRILSQWEKKTAFVADYVLAGKRGRLERDGLLKRIVLAPFKGLMRSSFRKWITEFAGHPETTDAPFEELLLMADRIIRVNEKCTGCGICEKVCPVGNIKMIDAKPVWQHRCETCRACINWCPAQAVCWGHDEPDSTFRYKYPGVKLADMLVR